MLYSSVGLLALFIQLIINHDILFNTSDGMILPVNRLYSQFLLSVTLYFITDLAWGILYELHLMFLIYADTVVYFAAMAFSILFWTRYVIAYLKDNNAFSRILSVSGWILFVFEILVLFVNFVHPVLFSFDQDDVYHALTGRYIILVLQIAMFFFSGVYALTIAGKRTETMKLRHNTIGLSSLTMAAFILLQAIYPLMPLYAIGCLLSTCILRSFVLENEKNEYRDQLEERLQDNILKGNYYDLLTGLPGMSYFFELVRKKRKSLIQSRKTPAFLYLNLSGMKFYNQKHGFDGGDRLLRSYAQLLISIFGKENCSRFGRDHFAIIADSTGIEGTLNKLFSEWNALHPEECPPILAGIYLDDPKNTDVADVTTAYDLAKLACDSIHTNYHSSFCYFDSSLYVSVERKQYIISHLDQAIAEKWIQVYYQPIIRSTNGHVCDEEALARWIDPTRGFLSPADFIPILEEAELIYKLDLYVVEEVLAKMKKTKEAGLHLVHQSINLSRSDFDACDIVEEICRRIDSAGISRKLFTIEITESIIGSDFDFMKAQIERFRSLGFPVWMDDFGSGYSSLDVLQSLTVDLIKLDMRFMQQFSHDNKNRIILTELMKMAVGLGIDTVCEGVEHEDQVEFLREIGCAKLQGYYYTKPLPLDQILTRYETGTQIGFENPNESDYFEAIGRINLYDLAVLAKDDTDKFRHYFSTIPMAIIEVRNNKARFTRSNQAYRDFMHQTFSIDISCMGSSFEKTPEGPGQPFVQMLHRCCEEGGRAVFDESLPDGTTVHSFMRRIADNPLTGTTAAVVAVLAVNDAL